MCDLASGCECWVAVTRTLRELKARNVPETAAFDAAAAVYRFHHPEVSSFEAKFTIAEWADEIDCSER